MKGDNVFLKSLADTPENQRFKLAGHFVFIRGGDRAGSGPTGANATPMGQPGTSGAGKGKGKGKNSNYKNNKDNQENRQSEEEKKEEATKRKEGTEDQNQGHKRPRNSPDERQGRQDGEKGARMEDE